MPLHPSLGDRVRPCLKKKNWSSCEYMCRAGTRSWRVRRAAKVGIRKEAFDCWEQSQRKIRRHQQKPPLRAGCGGSCLWSQHFGRPRQVDHEVRSSRPAWPIWWNPVSTKNTKISWAWWHMPVVPVTREAEAEESLEPRRWRLQWTEITPLHSSLSNRTTLSQKKKNKYREIWLSKWKKKWGNYKW